MDIELTRVFDSPKEKVFNALTNADAIKKWSDGDAILAPENGARYEMFGKWVCSIIDEVEEDKKLIYTWECVDLEDGHPPTEVKYELHDHPKGTKLTLHHTGFDNEKVMLEHKSKWENKIFVPMENYLKLN